LSLLYPHRHLSRKVRAFTEWLESLLSKTRCDVKQ
ncbi:LysR family transcriptional regulator, partial [Escherichia coli]|nr:LysR family transcriptional regulator [Escherichia coli]